MAAYGAGDLDSMHKLINFGTKITFLLLMMVTLPLVCSAQWILTLWLKQPPEYSTQLVILTLLSINVSSFTYFLAQGIHASGNITKQQIWLSGSYLISILVIFFIFKAGLSFYYAIYVNMGVGFLQGCVNLYYARKYIGYSFKYFVKKIMIPVMFVLVILVIVFFFETKFHFAEISKFLIFAVTDIVVVPTVGMLILFDNTERTKVIQIIKKFCRK
jgi:O-antigen/teichoic acid export membrane protein